MLRAILGVVVGYVVMFFIVFATFSAAYLGMGVDRAFQPGTYEVTPLWVGVSFVLGLIAAIAGGWVCVAISKSKTVPVVFAAIVVLLGLAFAIPVLIAAGQSDPPARTSDVGNFKAMEHAKQPPWVALINPFLAAAGVLLGARLKGAPRTS